jgi:hypothetical protein
MYRKRAFYGHQNDCFEVVEVTGAVLKELQLFVGNGSARKFRGILEDGRRFHFYIQAWLGFWSGLDEADYDALTVDYDDCECIDYTERYHLAGQKIERASCDQTSAGTCIEIRTPLGVVRLFALDPHDPHSDCGAEFIPTPLAGKPE